MLRRKSNTLLAACLVSLAAVSAGCGSTPLTDARQILQNAVTAMTPDSNVMATPGPGKLESLHFVVDAGGQFTMGIPGTAPTPVTSPSPSPSAAASPSASMSAGPTPSPSPLSSAEASASAAVASAVASAAAASASASAVASATTASAASASASAAEASASASAVVAASASPTPTPTPYFTVLPFSLSQAHAEGDVDLVNKTAHIVGWMPSVAGLSGELIIVDPYMYTRGYGQTQYQLGYDSGLPINPAVPSGVAYVLNQILNIAADSRLSPVLVGTEQEPYGAAYHIRVDVTPTVANDSLAASGQLVGTGTLNLWILQNGFWLERLEFSTSDPSAGAAAIRIVMSNFNGVQPILPPPDAQIFTETASPSAGQ